MTEYNTGQLTELQKPGVKCQIVIVTLRSNAENVIQVYVVEKVEFVLKTIIQNRKNIHIILILYSLLLF